MRVLVWQWGRYGAGPRFALELAKALERNCGCTTLLSMAEGAELFQQASLSKVVDLPLRTYANAHEFVARTLDIRRILAPLMQRLDIEKPDVAIVTMMGYWDVFLVRRLKRMGVPVVAILHDAEVHPGDRFQLALYLQRHILRRVDGVVTLTEFVGHKIAARVDLAGKVLATIPLPAFDYAELDLPAPSLPEGKRDRPLRLLLAGRLKRYKGLDFLANALKLIGDVPIKLRVAGAAADPGEIAELASFPGTEINLGWQSDRALIAHLDWSDAAILPYIEASQSGIAPMSFSRARPVIATPVGGLPEQIRHEETGLIAKSTSPQDLAATVRCFAADKALAQHLGEGALRYAQEAISWRTLAPRFAAILEAVARKGANKAA